MTLKSAAGASYLSTFDVVGELRNFSFSDQYCVRPVGKGSGHSKKNIIRDRFRCSFVTKRAPGLGEKGAVSRSQEHVFWPATVTGAGLSTSGIRFILKKFSRGWEVGSPDGRRAPDLGEKRWFYH